MYESNQISGFVISLLFSEFTQSVSIGLWYPSRCQDFLNNMVTSGVFKLESQRSRFNSFLYFLLTQVSYDKFPGKFPRPHSPHMWGGMIIFTSEDHIHSVIFILSSSGISLSTGSLLKLLTESISPSSALSSSIHNKLSMCLPSLLICFACLPSPQNHEFLCSKEHVLCIFVFSVKLVTFVEQMSEWALRHNGGYISSVKTSYDFAFPRDFPLLLW